MLSDLLGWSLQCCDRYCIAVLNTVGLKLIGVDLTQLELLERSLLVAGINFSLPTLLLSEVSLTYMEPER